MEIFFGNVPDNLNGYELRNFANNLLDERDVGFQFWKKKLPESMNFKVIERNVEGNCFHYAIATIEPADIARECIKLFNQKFLNGKPLEVREYQPRSYMNERRAVGWRDKTWNAEERRTTDRRHCAV